MPSQIFTDYQGIVPAAWLNDVNTSVYTTLPSLSTSIAGLNALTSAIGAGLGGDRLLNGDFRLNSRQASALSSGVGLRTYGLDRWFVFATGAAVTVSQGTSFPSYNGTHMSITGASGNTSVLLAQRILSANIKDCASQVVTVSFWAFQSTGSSSVNLTVSGSVPVGLDNWTSQTPFSGFTVTLSPGSSGWTFFSGQLTLPAGASNGLELDFTYPGIVIGATFSITNVKLEKGSTPTPFQSREYSIEANACAYYAPVFTFPAGSFYIGAANAPSTTTAQVLIPFTSRARVAPTGIGSPGGGSVSQTGITVQIGSGTGVSTAVTFNGASNQNCGVLSVTFPAIGAAGGGLAFSNQAQTIIFSGVEL